MHDVMLMGLLSFSIYLFFLRCDFAPQCSDASDESQCGTCDFENSQCGWSDVSEGAFKWRREDSSVVTDPNGPQTDADNKPSGMLVYIYSIFTLYRFMNARLKCCHYEAPHYADALEFTCATRYVS